jgi:hypothetical protein
MQSLVNEIESDAELLKAHSARIFIGRREFSLQVREEIIIRIEQFGTGFEVQNTFSFEGAVAERLSVERWRDNYRSDARMAAEKVGQLLYAYVRLTSEAAKRID